MNPPETSLAIMAHPRREMLVRRLLPDLPGATVAWDRRNDRWETGRRALMAFDPAAEWHVVIQDDAVLCRHFTRHLQRYLAMAGRGPVGLYAGITAEFGGVLSSVAMRQALQSGASFVEEQGPLWGVGIAIRTEDIPHVVRWGDEDETTEQYDLKIAGYFGSLGRPCLYTVPSLVNHRVGPDNPSLIPNRGSSPGRTAAVFRPGGPEAPTGRIWGPREGDPLFSIAITIHPRRRDFLFELEEAIDGPVSVVWDEGAGAWDTAVRAWQARDRSARFHVVVQDDAVPCQEFRRHLRNTLQDPLACYGLYYGGNVGHMRTRAIRELRAGSREVIHERLYWGVGIALPTAFVGPMLRWEREQTWPDGWKGARSDSRVGRFCMAHGIPVRYPLPSLLDHRVGRSLVREYPQRPEERVALWHHGTPMPKEART